MSPRPPRAALLLAAALAASCAAGSDPIPYSVPGGGGGEAAEAPVLDATGGDPAAGAGVPGVRGLVPAGEDPPVALVDGRPVRASEVARFLFRYETSKALDVLNQILDSAVIEADAAAAGVVLPRGEVEARTEEQVRRWETDIRVQYGPETSLDDYLRDRFGFTRESFRADIASLVRLQALRDRLVRYEASREDRLRIRVLVVDSEEKARDAIARLREGADFTALARQVSVFQPLDLPAYRREDIRPEELAGELFALEQGGVSRPVRVERDGKPLYEVFKVVEKRPGRDRPWAEAAAEIERDLRERPVTPAEYVQWARRTRERHGVKVLLEEPAAAGGEKRE